MPGSGAPSSGRQQQLPLLLAPHTVPFHVVSPLSTDTFVNSPLLNSPQITQFECTFCLLLDCGWYKVIYKGQTLGNWPKENLPIFPRALSDPLKLPDIRSRQWQGTGMAPYSTLPSIPLLFQALLSYFNTENSTSTVFSDPTDYKSHFWYVTEFHSNKTINDSDISWSFIFFKKHFSYIHFYWILGTDAQGCGGNCS